MKGILYGVGVGPGDPELLTAKAIRLLRECDAVAAPKSADGRQTALDIASPYIGQDKTILLFDMPMTHDLKRMISELMKGGVPCPEPVRDVKALLPTTAQSSYVPAVASYPQPPVYAESEEVTDEPPREMTKADMQREQIIRALRRNNGRRREAAAELFMSERTLYRKIKELGIEDNS